MIGGVTQNNDIAYEIGYIGDTTQNMKSEPNND